MTIDAVLGKGSEFINMLLHLPANTVLELLKSYEPYFKVETHMWDVGEEQEFRETFYSRRDAEKEAEEAAANRRLCLHLRGVALCLLLPNDQDPLQVGQDQLPSKKRFKFLTVELLE